MTKNLLSQNIECTPWQPVWAGRLGRIAKCCLYCGESGGHFNISSHPTKCTRCSANDTPIPALYEECMWEYERLAKEWCVENNIDYEAETKRVEEYERNNPPDPYEDVAIIYSAFVCENFKDCGQEYFDPELDFQQLAEQAKSLGWKVTPKDEDWLVLCPSCPKT